MTSHALRPSTFGENDRYAGAEHAHERHLTCKQRHAVARGQQVGKVEQKRPDQVGRDAENAEIPAAQRAPNVLPGYKHQRNAEQTQPHQQHTAGKVRGLSAALGAAGCLTAASRRCGTRRRRTPGAAAGRTRARRGTCAFFAAGAGSGFFTGTRLCHVSVIPSLVTQYIYNRKSAIAAD